MMEKLLLIEDDAVFAQVLQNSLQKRGLECMHLSSIQQLDELQDNIAFDYVVLDLYLDGDSGLSVLPQIRQNHPGASILVLTDMPVLLLPCRPLSWVPTTIYPNQPMPVRL